MDSGLAAARRPGMTGRNQLSSDRVVEILPIRVLTLDQVDLPLAPPFLEFFLTRDGVRRIVIVFEPHKNVDTISGRKAANDIVLVFVYAPHEVARDTQVSRPMFAAG